MLSGVLRVPLPNATYVDLIILATDLQAQPLKLMAHFEGPS